jgi:hypothetical protein
MEPLDDILSRSKDTKLKTLNLSYMHLDKLPNLTDFEWVTELDISHNELSFLMNLPPKLEKLEAQQNVLEEEIHFDIPISITHLNVSHNKLHSIFDGSMFPNLTFLQMNSNKITEFAFPPNIKMADISSNLISDLDIFPESLHSLDCSYNTLQVLSGLNHNLVVIDFSNNGIYIFPDFSNCPEITCIRGTRTKVSSINYLPPKLKKISMSYCAIDEINCALPLQLKVLHIGHNTLIEMPELPPFIEEVLLNDNMISELRKIPASVEKLNVSNNLLLEIPNYLKHRIFKELDYSGNRFDSGDELTDSEDDDFWSGYRNSQKNIHVNTYSVHGKWNHLYPTYRWTTDHTHSVTSCSYKSSGKMGENNPNHVSYGNKRIVVL